MQIHSVRWALLRRVHRCVAAGMHRDRVGIGRAIFRSPPRRQLREKSNAARMARRDQERGSWRVGGLHAVVGIWRYTLAGISNIIFNSDL